MTRFVSLVLAIQVMLHASSPPGPGASSQPVALDVDHRAVVRSPDGKWSVRFSEDDTGTWAGWLLMQGPADREPVRVLPIQRSCHILWREDSKVFAVLDARFANHYFVLVGMPGEHSSLPLVDLTPSLERSLRLSLAGRWDLDKIYWKVFRWLPDGTLLVGVEAVIFKRVAPPPKWEPAEDIHRGYVVDVTTRRILRHISQGTMYSKFGIDLQHQDW